MLALNTYFGHQFPSAAGRGLHKLATAFQELMRAHILAYNRVHEVYSGARDRPRRDRITRSQFLRLHLHEVERIRKAGIPLLGYFHWSLFDNYEWGTYTPRFGLYS